MATRMMTLLYGETPGSDVEPGNRVDSASSGIVSKVPPLRPIDPTPTPWARPRRARPLALRGMMIGMAAVAAVFAGLALFSVALVWGVAMSQLAQISLMVIGGYLLAAGAAYVAASPDADHAAQRR